MKRITRDNTIPKGANRYEVYEPVATVDLHESFVVETINSCTPVIRTPQDVNPEVHRGRRETGPIFVNGIAPGDVLAIHIEAIEPEGHARGGQWDDSNLNSFLEIKDGKVHFPGGLRAPEQMMMGDIFVMPVEHQANPWDYGGNMDFKDVAAGNTLHLRAEHEGALLVLGDLHACQGDGEILGLGAECAGNVQLRITKDDKFLPVRPMIKKPHSFVCIACRHAYHEARDLAAADASKIFARITGVTEKEAHLYCTIVGDLRNGAVWGMGKHDFPVVVGLEVPLQD